MVWEHVVEEWRGGAERDGVDGTGAERRGDRARTGMGEVGHAATSSRPVFSPGASASSSVSAAVFLAPSSIKAAG